MDTAPQLTANNLNENVKGGPTNDIPYAASSVCINVSSLVGIIEIILVPTSNLWSPAVFVDVGVKYTKSSWFDHLTSIGSIVVEPKGVHPPATKCLSGNDTVIQWTLVGTPEAPTSDETNAALVVSPLSDVSQ